MLGWIGMCVGCVCACMSARLCRCWVWGGRDLGWVCCFSCFVCGLGLGFVWKNALWFETSFLIVVHCAFNLSGSFASFICLKIVADAELAVQKLKNTYSMISVQYCFYKTITNYIFPVIWCSSTCPDPLLVLLLKNSCRSENNDVKTN